MVAAALDATTRYYPVGTRQWYWVDTLADYKTPTRTELDAGTDLTGEVAETDGFTTSSDSIDTPDYGKRFVGKIPGRINADDSSITFYADRDSADVRAVLHRDDVGFIAIFPEGDDEAESDHTMDIFPVTVASVSKPTSDSDAARIVVSFTITGEPAQDVAVPAAA